MIERNLGFQHSIQHPSISDTSDMQEVDRVTPTTIGVHATPYEASRLIYQGTKPWLENMLLVGFCLLVGLWLCFFCLDLMILMEPVPAHICHKMSHVHTCHIKSTSQRINL